MRRVSGLKALAADYDCVLCDVWGVIHNGVAAFPTAVEALTRFRDGGGRVILVTNAPRPHAPIVKQLGKLGVGIGVAFDRIVTSGDVTRDVIAARPGAKVFHIGPERDFSFYEGLDVALVGEDEAEIISCTGFFHDDPAGNFQESPDDYAALFERLVARGLPMVCANPDIVVERGHTLIWCAGALAQRYAQMGGTATLAGKPHKPIYDAARRHAAELGCSRLLAIGDGLPTDIRGASDNGIDVLFVTGGIHSADFGPLHDPDAERVAARLAAEKLRAVAHIPVLAWDAA